MSALPTASLFRQVLAVYTRQAPAFQPRSRGEVTNWTAAIDRLLEAKAERAAQQRIAPDEPHDGERLASGQSDRRSYIHWALLAIALAIPVVSLVLGANGSPREVWVAISSVSGIYNVLLVLLERRLRRGWGVARPAYRSEASKWQTVGERAGEASTGQNGHDVSGPESV